jgi:glutamine amidotransferase
VCELLAMSCRHPARLTFSLAALAHRARLPSRNQDGWGLAYYQGPDVALYRDTTSADHHPLVDWLMQHGPATQTAIGYIRHSTQGEISLANTGPFIRELNGRIHTFVHNGNLRHPDKVRTLRDGRFQPIGETDSERAFCELLENMAALPKGEGELASLEARMVVLSDMARQFRDCGPSNFLYGDGDALFVHADQRYQDAVGVISPPALHMFECSADEIPGLVCDAEPPLTGDVQRVILLATVPLSDHPWQAMDRGQLLALRDGVVVAQASQ